MQSKRMNGYTLYTTCRFCHQPLKKPVIDLGNMPLAGGFLKAPKDFAKEKLYPLTLAFCQKCYLLQTREVIPANRLFKNYFYFSSTIQTLVTHFQETAQQLSKQFSTPSEKLVVEIGCNDGTFIKACLAKGFQGVGVDPATNVVKPLIQKGLPIINDYFGITIAKNIIKKYGQADIIFSSNTLAHIENMHEIFSGIKKLLKQEGMLIFEVHDLNILLKKLHYDMIYHEHQYYYSVHAIKNFLKQFDMEIFDVQQIPIHGGSLRFSVQHKGAKRNIQKSVAHMLQKEKNSGLLKKGTYTRFNQTIQKTRNDLQNILQQLQKKGKTIVGYGASGRGTIISNYCGLDEKFLDRVLDDAPAKINYYMPGTHVKIYSSNTIYGKKKPDYIVLFAWAFLSEIKKRHTKFLQTGGKFIVPLPIAKIIS